MDDALVIAGHVEPRHKAKGGRTTRESPDGTFDAPVPFEMRAAAVQPPGQFPLQGDSCASQADPAGRGPAGVAAALIGC